MVLHSISELEKAQKSIVAIKGSLCKENLIFYCTEGSSSIKVTAMDSKEIPKKIPRKSTNRNSQIASLSYCSTSRLLACGASDGVVQLWCYSDENTLQGKEETVVSLAF